ncbi:hypothetical protein cmbei_2003600 [Cryptosporidium meleagridis]
MEEDLIEKIISSIKITLNPSRSFVDNSLVSEGDTVCGASERSQSEYFLDKICDQENLRIDEVVFEVLKSAKLKSRSGLIEDDLQHGVEFISLSILDKFVIRRWTQLRDEDRSRVRNKLLEISVYGIDNVDDDMILVNSTFALRKLCCTFSRVIIQDYFASWKVFVESILDYRSRLMSLDKPGMAILGSGIYLRNRNISNLTRLVLGITKEISETLLINNSNINELNSKMRASCKNGLCDEIEPILRIISDELQNACNLKGNRGMMNIDISLVKQSLDCLKNLTNIINSGKLLNLRLDDLLIMLHSTGILENDEEILDLFDSLVQNLTKNKKGQVFILDYQDLNRFVLGVANLVKKTVLLPKLFIEDPDYDTSLTHLNWMKLFKDLIEGCIPAIVRIPDNIVLETSNNKMNTITLIWKIALILCMHPYIAVCDLSISTLCQILRTLAKDFPKNLSKDGLKYFQLVKDFQIDVLLVVIFARSLRIGDPKINYLTDEWSQWNSLISNMILNSIEKLDSESFNILFHFQNQSYNFSLIISKYFKLLDQYNIADSSYIKVFSDFETSENTQISKNNNMIGSSFNNSYSSLRNRIIQLVNCLVDFGQGILLDQLLETCLNISILIFSSQPFNIKCKKHLAVENSWNNSSQTLCKKLVIVDGIFIILETIICRVNSKILDTIKNETFPDSDTLCGVGATSFFDLLSRNIEYREQKIWISSLFKLMNGILQLSLLDLCGSFLESRRLIFISQTVMCIEWYQELYKNSSSSMISSDEILKIYLSYLLDSGKLRIYELRRTASNCLSRILLSHPKLFEKNLLLIIQLINENLNNSCTCFEEKTILNSVLIAATNALGDFNKISESCEMTSKAAFSMISRNSFRFSNQEEVLEFLFKDLIESVKISKEPIESNWKNLILLKNSLTLLFSIFGNIKLPEDFSTLKSGGFLKEESSHFILRHPLENCSRQIFETLCLITLTFLQISDNHLNTNITNNKFQLEELNIISLFNSISDQEWMHRSGIKNQSDNKIIKLSQITSYKMIFFNSFIQIRRINFSIRNLLIKLLVFTFTLGTYKDIFNDQNNKIILNPGQYFDEVNVNLLIKTLIDPIRYLPIHILNFIIKNGLAIVLSPQSLPRFQDGHPTDIFLEEVFLKRFVPIVLDRLKSEWQNLMISQAFILSSSISELKGSNLENLSLSTIPFQDPFKVLLNLNFDNNEFQNNIIQDNSLYNVIYNSHYNDLSETCLTILKIINGFILSTNRQWQSNFKSKTGSKLINYPDKFKSLSNSDEDFQMDISFSGYKYNQNQYYEDHEFQDSTLMDCEDLKNCSSQKNKVQPKHAVLSQVFLLNQNLMRSCLEILIEFLSFPDPNILETSLHIIQRYLQLYINFTNQGIHSKYSHIHVFLIKNLLIQLFKVGPRALPFDPLNLSPSKNDNIKIVTPLNSYIKLNHPNLLKNSIIDCIQSIIRSDQDCLNFINNTKNELSKDLSNGILTCRNISSSNSMNYNNFLSEQQIPIPDNILGNAYENLEFLFSNSNEYLPSGSERIFSQQDLIFMCKTFLQEHIMDIVFSTQTPIFSALIGNILQKLGQISSQNEQNPYINFTTFIKPTFLQ